MDKHVSIKLLVSILVIVLSFIYIVGSPSYSNEIASINEMSTYNYKENVTSYNASDGVHKIYWAQGINVPKMTNDPKLLGTKGYFMLENIGNFSTYMHEFELNKGYYDYNKNLDSRGHESKLCYLGAAANLISWWLDQNEDLVNEYLSKLKSGNVYGQDPQLHKILPFNQTMWNDIMKDPGLEVQQGYKAQKLGKSPLVTEYLKPYYYKKDDGYYSDMVFDFFFNGYDPIPVDGYVPPNNEYEFKKDIRGGFFYPIFGKHRLANRVTGKEITNQVSFGNTLKNAFTNGKGVAISYLINANIAHAITVWGAEYDSNGKIVRIFITDTDDYQAANSGDTYWRGLVGMNIVPDKNGVIALTNQNNFDINKPGVYLTSLMTLDLGRDYFSEALKDTKDPVKPKISKEPGDAVYALNANLSFSVVAAITDRGDLEYEWYEATDKDSPGTRIKGAKDSVLKVKASKLGVKYYYCIVKNYKNGKVSSSETKHFKVDVQNIKLVNAEAPKLSFNYRTLTYDQFDDARPIKCEASVSDGGTLSYEWYLSNDSTSSNGRKINGETKDYIVPNTKNPTRGLYYYCVVTNTNNKVNGERVVKSTSPYSKRIIVNEKVITEASSPVITKEPLGGDYYLNDNVTLSVLASIKDNGTLKYEWIDLSNGKETVVGSGTSYKVNTSKVGKYKLKVKVTNYNSHATNIKEKVTYSKEVNVNVSEKLLSSDNELKSLIVNNARLSPDFKKNVYEYKATIPHKDSNINIFPSANSKAKVSIVNPIIEVGKTKDVVISVKAENGSVRKYTIHVTRDPKHVYGDWVNEVAATCLKGGKQKRVCSVDGHIEYRDVKALGHDFSSEWTFDKLPTTTETGIKSHHCKRCGERKDVTVVPALKDHTKCTFGKWVVVKKPTCTSKGEEVRTCQVCGKKEHREIPALGHDFSSEWTFDKLPTTTETGIKSHHCKRCGERKDVTVVPVIKEHTKCSFGEWIIVKEPTLTETGLKKRICSVCGKEETEVIPVLSSNKETKKGISPIIIGGVSVVIILGIGFIIYYKKGR